MGYVRAEADPATGGMRHRFTGTDGATSVHATREGALREMEVWQAMQSVKDMKTLRQAAERGQMQHLAAPGMRSEGAQVSDEARDVTTSDPSAKDLVGTRAMESRIALSVLQQRAYTGDAGGAQAYRVRAMRYAKQTLDGAYQGVIRFFKGRDIGDVFEEFSEDALARGLSEGLVDGASVLRDLRKVEQATGMELLPSGYGIDAAAGEADVMPLLEGFSKLARAHAWGNVRTGALPERTAGWMDMLVATQAGMLRKAENSLIRADLARAGQFKEALAKGEVTPELEKLLRGSGNRGPAETEGDAEAAGMEESLPKPKIRQITSPGTDPQVHVFEAPDGTRSGHATWDEAQDAYETREAEREYDDWVGQAHSGHGGGSMDPERMARDYAEGDRIVARLMPKSTTARGKGKIRKALLGELTAMTAEEIHILRSPVEIMLRYSLDGKFHSARRGEHHTHDGPANVIDGETFCHNHPGGKGPGNTDLRLALRNPTCTVRVVARGKHGRRVYRIRAKRAADPKMIEEITRNYKTLCNKFHDTAAGRDRALELISRKYGDLITVERRAL
jgi:hypothetical protein